MKKIVMLGLAVMLTGCGMSHEEVSELKDKCYAVGGEPVILVQSDLEGGSVPRSVRCKIDGLTYIRGDF